MASICSSLVRYIPTVIGSFFPTLYGRELPTPTEDRWDTIGKPANTPYEGVDSLKGVAPKLTLGKVHGLLFVVYTDRIILGREMIRLISARKATKFEEMLYINGGK